MKKKREEHRKNRNLIVLILEEVDQGGCRHGDRTVEVKVGGEEEWKETKTEKTNKCFFGFLF